MKRAILLFGIATLACGGAPAPAEHEPATALDVAAPPPPPRPIDVLELTPPGVQAVALLRIDLVRGSAVEPIAARWLGEDPDLRLLGAAGIDVLADVDKLVVAGAYAARTPVVVIEHHLPEIRLVEALGRLESSTHARESPSRTMNPGNSRTEAALTARIENMGRYRVAVTDGGSFRVVIVSPQVAVVVSRDDLAGYLEALESGAMVDSDLQARIRALDRYAPDLAGTASVRVAARAPEPWEQGPGRLGLPRPVWMAGLVALSEGASLFGLAGYLSESEAERSVVACRELLSQPLSPATLMLRLMGLSRALEAAQVSAHGKELSVRVHLDMDETQRVLDRLRWVGEQE